MCKDEAGMRAAIKFAPIESVFTIYEDFMYYIAGIYSHRSGDSLGIQSTLIIGWGEEMGIKYWIC